MKPACYAEVAVPLAVRGTFTYAVPDELREEVRPGVRVEIPWGTKILTGFVLSMTDEIDIEASRIREIQNVLDPDLPSLIPEIIELCRWASYYYLTPPGEMLRVAVPSNMTARSKRRVRVIASEEAIAQALEEGRLRPEDLDTIASIGTRLVETSRLERETPEARRSLRRLLSAGVVDVEEVLRDAAGVRMDRWIILTDEDTTRDSLTSVQQAEIVAILESEGGRALYRDLLEAGGSASAIATLERKGLLRVDQVPRLHDVDSFIGSFFMNSNIGELEHSDAQRSAIRAITNRLGAFRPFLLQGVTGSGKTEIYIEVARQVVARGSQAILLVPEIGLTPALAARLRERFGERVVILHSGLSGGERYDQWWRARRGEVDVAVGPRSALFTPFQNLGLIVVDEEGDGAYKQEEAPRYNARDLAVVRARLHSIPVVLGSATPSLESRWNVDRGKYEHIVLPDRIASRALPTVETVDIKREPAEKEDRGLVMFSSRLREEMQRVFTAGEQAIVLMNRRGYAPFLLCRECENDFRCRDCSVTTTVHLRDGRLVCHYCGLKRPIPRSCPECGGEVLQPIGFGTEKVEERFKRYFPGVPVEVLDRDTARRKGALVQILERFRQGRTQCLIGTQIISKGHDFPNVTLTAVINADTVLGYPDFRSAEKTFYLLTQVAGRSGRGDLPGRVLIQTAFPEHYAISHAVSHDYEAFYNAEIEFRKRFHYPPVTTMIAVLFRGDELAALEQTAAGAGERLARELRGVPDARMQGPAPAPLARIKGAYRFQGLLRSSNRYAIRSAVEKAITLHNYPGIDVVVDVDPLNIL